jgi:hypothetical protein
MGLIEISGSKFFSVFYAQLSFNSKGGTLGGWRLLVPGWWRPDKPSQ